MKTLFDGTMTNDTQKPKGLQTLVLPKGAFFISSFCDSSIFVLCIYATFYKIPHKTS